MGGVSGFGYATLGDAGTPQTWVATVFGAAIGFVLIPLLFAVISLALRVLIIAATVAAGLAILYVISILFG